MNFDSVYLTIFNKISLLRAFSNTWIMCNDYNCLVLFFIEFC